MPIQQLAAGDVESTAVVRHRQAQAVRPERDPHLDRRRICMFQGVVDRLPHDPQQLVLHEGRHAWQVAGGVEPNRHGGERPQISHLRRQRFQERAIVAGRIAEIPEEVVGL